MVNDKKNTIHAIHYAAPIYHHFFNSSILCFASSFCAVLVKKYHIWGQVGLCCEAMWLFVLHVGCGLRAGGQREVIEEKIHLWLTAKTGLK